MGAEAIDQRPVQSPWRTIWFSPRTTMRGLIETDARPSWVPVILLAIPVLLLDSIQSIRSTSSVAATPTATLIFTFSKFQFFNLVAAPFVLAFVGHWLGGIASAARLWSAIVWSHIPIAAASVFWMPVVLIFGPRVLLEALTGPLPSLSHYMTQSAGFWGLIILSAMIAEAQRFSLGRAIVTLIALYVALILFVAGTIQIERLVGLR